MTQSLDSSTMQTLLENIPVCLLIREGNQIKWVNDCLAASLHTSKDILIGLEMENATGTVFAPLFEESEQLCLTESSGKTHWLRRENIDIGEAKLTVQMFRNITEKIKLDEKIKSLMEDVHSLETKDSATGMLNKKAIIQNLESQVSRSRRYENPLSLLRLTLESPDDSVSLEETLRTIAHGLKDQLRWADQIGMLDKKTFLIILPETSLEVAKELAAKLANDRATFAASDSNWTIKFGATGWQKGDDPRKLLQRLKQDQELSLIALLS